MTLLRWLTLALCSLPTLPARDVDFRDGFALAEIGESAISPDGRTVLFTVTRRYLIENRTESRLMEIPAVGGEPRLVRGAPEGASHIRWSADSQRIAFTAAKALWVLHPATGQSQRLCAYARSNAFLSKTGNELAWSPDGRSIAFAGTTEPEPPAADPVVVTRTQYKTRTALWDGRRTHLYVVPAAGGSPRLLTPGHADEHSLAWGGDGSEIVFLSDRAADPDAAFNYDIFAVNVATGAVRQITRTPGVEMNPVVSPDGRSIAFTSTRRSLTTIDSVAEDAHLWVVPLAGPLAGSDARELNAALDRRTNSAPAWSPEGLVYLAADHGRQSLYRVAANGGPSERLLDRDAQAAALSVARDGTVVFTLSTPSAPVELYRLVAGSPRRLTSLNTAAVEDWTLSQPERLAFNSFDGTPIEGWLYPPLHSTGGAGTILNGLILNGLILNIHGGPHGMHGYAFNAALHAWAARGYAVLLVNPRGSSGYGQKFADGCVDNWGGGDYQDLMAGVDYVLKTHPNLSPQRLGVTGGSYGGFMTNWIVTQTPRFRAAVASASLSNLVSFYATSLYQDLVHAEFRGFPWDGDNFARLWRWSPLAHIKNVTTPTLLLHGEQDNDVHITQAEEMYTALRRRRVDSALVRYPREGHGLQEPQHQLDALERTFTWMHRHLAP